MVPRQRDVQVTPTVWVSAVGNKAASKPVPGGRANVKGRRVGKGVVRQLMLDCAQREWLHISSSITSGVSSGVVTPLNDLSQGTANSTRLGNQTRWVELEYCGYGYTPVTDASEALRFVIFKDTQPEGALPTVSELLCAANSSSCFNPDLVGNQERPRFVILSNVFRIWNNPGPFSTGAQNTLSEAISGRLRLDMTTTYEGNAGTYADIQTNGLYFLVIGNNSGTGVFMEFCLKYLRM